MSGALSGPRRCPAQKQRRTRECGAVQGLCPSPTSRAAHGTGRACVCAWALSIHGFAEEVWWEGTSGGLWSNPPRKAGLVGALWSCLVITGLCLMPVTIPSPALLLLSGHCRTAFHTSGSLPCLPCRHPCLPSPLPGRSSSALAAPDNTLFVAGTQPQRMHKPLSCDTERPALLTTHREIRPFGCLHFVIQLRLCAVVAG